MITESDLAQIDATGSPTGRMLVAEIRRLRRIIDGAAALLANVDVDAAPIHLSGAEARGGRTVLSVCGVEIEDDEPLDLADIGFTRDRKVATCEGCVGPRA